MRGIGDHDAARARDRLGELLGIDRRHEGVVGAEHDQSLGAYPRQAAPQPLVRDRPDEFRHAGEPLHRAHGLLDRIVREVRGIDHLRAGLAALPQDPVDGGVGTREQVGDRMIVAPQPERRDEDEPCHAAGNVRRQLRRDHGAIGMADERDAVEADRLEHIVVMQREVVHIADIVELVDIVETGRDRRDHAVAPGELADHRIVLAYAVRSMQPHERRTLPGAMNLNLAAAEQIDDFTLEHGGLCVLLALIQRRRRSAPACGSRGGCPSATTCPPIR